MPVVVSRYVTQTEQWEGFIGRTSEGDRYFLTIRLTMTNDRPASISISGETYQAGRDLDGDCVSCGQNMDTLRDVLTGTIADGLTAYDLTEMLNYWETYHLDALPVRFLSHFREIADRIEAVDGEQAEDPVTVLDYADARDQYDDWLDGIDGEVTVGNLSWPVGEVMRKMSPDDYRAGLSEWAANEGVDIDWTGSEDDES